MDTHMSQVAGGTGNLVLAKPIVDALVEEDASAVGIDVDAIFIRPEPARPENILVLRHRESYG